MSVLRSEDKKELLIDCKCGCDEGIRFRIDEDSDDDDMYCIMSYTNGKFYGEQDEKVLRVLSKKLKKIWAIIRNKDFYYSEVCMTKDDFKEFKKYIDDIE